jgi:hypothetical protein
VGRGHLNIQLDLMHATTQNGALHVERQRVEFEVARQSLSTTGGRHLTWTLKSGTGLDKK